MNLHEEGNEKISGAYCRLVDTCGRLTAYSEMLARWDGAQATTTEIRMFEMLKLNSECVALAVDAAYALHEVMEDRIDQLSLGDGTHGGSLNT